MNFCIIKAVSQRLVKLSFLLLLINGLVIIIGTVVLYWTLSQYMTEVQWLNQAKKQQLLSEKLSKTVLLIQSQLTIQLANKHLIELENILDSWHPVDWRAKASEQSNNYNINWPKLTDLQYHEQMLIALARQLLAQLTTQLIEKRYSLQAQNHLIISLVREQTILRKKHQKFWFQFERQMHKRAEQLKLLFWYFAITLICLFALGIAYFYRTTLQVLQPYLIKLIEQNHELEEEKSWFQAMFDNHSAIVYIKNIKNRYLFINRQYEKIFNLKREQILAKSDYEIFPSTIAARFQRNDLKVLNSETILEIEEEIIRDNELHIYLSIKFPLYNRMGELFAIGGISTDITQRKQAQKALQERETMFRTLLDAIPEPAFLINHQGMIFTTNEAAARTLSTNKVQLINQNLFDWLPTGLANCLQQEVKQVLDTGLSVRFQTQYDEYYFNYYLFPVPSDEKQLSNIAVVEIDISEYKQAQAKIEQLNEELEQRVAQRTHQLQITNQALTTKIASRQHTEIALRASEERYRRMIDTAQEGIWITDAQANTTFVNQQMANILGYRKEEIIGHSIFNFGLQTSHLDHTKTPLDFLLPRKQGDSLWVIINTNPQFDEQGELIGMFITMTNITQRKQAELAQQETLNLLQQVLSSLNEAVLVIDLKSNMIEQYNQTTEIIFGYQPEQLLAQSFEKLHLDQSHFAAFISEVKHTLQWNENQWNEKNQQNKKNDNFKKSDFSKAFKINFPKTSKFFITVCQMKRQNGEIFSTEMFVSPLKYDKNQVVKVVAIIKDITERQQIEAVINETEHKFQLLTETIASAIVIYEDEKFIYANPAATAITGYSKAELLQQRFWEIVHPDYQSIIKANGLAGQRGKEVPTRYEIKIATKEGEIKWIDVMACLMNYQGKQVTLASAFDITERKEIEETLHHIIEGISAATGNNFLQNLVSYLGERLQVKYTLIGQLVEEKKCLQTLFVVEDNQLVDNFVHEVLNTPYEGVLQGGLACCSYPANLSQKFPNNPWLTSQNIESFIGTPLFNSRGEIMGLMAIMDNKPLTHQKRIESMLQIFAARAAAELERVQALEALDQERRSLAKRVEERTVELTTANAELARAARLKDEFLANMSHELRTPLNAVLGMSEVLQEHAYGTLNERQAQALQTIEQSGRHLLGLINDILDLAKIEAGKIKLELSPVMVEYLGKNCLRLVQRSAEKKKIKTHFIFDQEVKLISVDERYLKQILLNLLSNAIKFTPAEGTVTLEILGDIEKETVHFMVSDTGIGIAMEKVGDRLFQPFVQLDGGLNRHHEGTGLGLSLVYRLAELHGGSVSVTSELDKGSCFTVSLPWQLIDDNNQTNFNLNVVSETELENISSDNVPFAKQSDSLNTIATILLVDDNPVICQTIFDYLTVKGYLIVMAHNGIQAIEKTKELHPDLILMDIQMPTMDGLEAIQQLRADEQPTKPIPIIALTALAMPGDKQRCLEAGANAYLSKPVSFKQLLSNIEELL